MLPISEVVLVAEYGAECGEIKQSLPIGAHIKKKKSRQIETNTDEQNKEELTRAWLLSELELSICCSSPGISADLLSLIYLQVLEAVELER